jgi:hypothetical protein
MVFITGLMAETTANTVMLLPRIGCRVARAALLGIGGADANTFCCHIGILSGALGHDSEGRLSATMTGLNRPSSCLA